MNSRHLHLFPVGTCRPENPLQSPECFLRSWPLKPPAAAHEAKALEGKGACGVGHGAGTGPLDDPAPLLHLKSSFVLSVDMWTGWLA